MIRQAEPSDIDVIAAICIEAHQKSAYAHIPIVEICGRQLIAHCILKGFSWMTECGNGVLLGYTQPLWFDHDKTGATDLVFYVRESAKGDGVKLAKKYLEWGKANADAVMLGITFGGDAMERTEQFYERLGLVKIGGQFLLKGDVCQHS